MENSMSEAKNFFADSAAYELAMGRCSRVAGKMFLEWLSLPDGLKWLDVGCGTGSFTELVLNRNAPSAISAIDPSEGQIEFAKGKPWASAVDFRQGDAMSLPFSEDEFDVAVMALVIQYIPDPAKAMSEITRVVRPGGIVATYTWPDSFDEHPMQPMAEAINSIGVSRTRRPGNQIRTIDALTTLFGASGLIDIDSRSIEIQLVYEDFDDYWRSQTADAIREMTDSEIQKLKTLLKERLPPDENGRISYKARANAIRARAPE
jgi:ubiquinone/menaquinone biosynthesis C-methylase UbiE